MRLNGYPKEKIEKESMVQVVLSNQVQRKEFLCFQCIIVFTLLTLWLEFSLIWIRVTYADIQKIENLIRQCVPIPQKTYNIAKRQKTPEEVEKYFLGFMAFIDTTEQPIPRPTVDKDRRKIFYSGKKKRYAVKNQLMVNNCGYILHKAAHKKGKRHEHIFENIRITILSPSPNKLLMCLILDILEQKRISQNSYPPYHIKRKETKKIYPKKKKKSTTEFILKKKRIVIEHTIICRLKKYRIINEVFRNKLRKYIKISDIVSGLLVNYRMINQSR